MVTTLLAKVSSPLLPNDDNIPIAYKRKAWQAINVRYEPSSQEMADEQFHNKIKNSPDHAIEIYRLYRHQSFDSSEWIVYQYNEMGTTNLNNLEMNSPDPFGLYMQPVARNAGVMNEQGIVEARPTEIRRYEPKFYIPYTADAILELARYIGDPYSIEFIAVPAGGGIPLKCPTAQHLAYMSFDQIRACAEGMENWPIIPKDLENLKKDYEERTKLMEATVAFRSSASTNDQQITVKLKQNKSPDREGAAERLQRAKQEQAAAAAQQS